MVAGDLVNTASRIQSLAEPGTVLVGEATRRATEQTVAYEDAGSHELKGKVGLTQFWRALRVVSGARGTLKSAGLEAPFVGRDRELRQIKDLFHACADEGKAHLVSITGIAGIGKSRLGWEFYKYFDGIVQIDVLAPRPLSLLRRGRHLLGARRHGADARADRRGRGAGLGAGQARRGRRGAHRRRGRAPLRRAAARTPARPRRGAARLRAGGSLRRLAALLRAAGRRLPGGDALRGHAVGGCLARSTSSSTCSSGRATRRSSSSRRRGRSCSSAGRPGAPATATSARSTSSRSRPRRWRSCSPASFPGLPAELRAQILARAEGIPLYAVETVRMLLDRGALVQDGPVYRPTGTIESLEVPETLHALIAARLDGLPAGRAAGRPGRGRARQDVHEAGARCPCRRCPRPSSSRSSRRSPARRSSACRPTRARRSTGSTASSRTSCARSPTRPLRRPTARRGTSPPRRFSSRR